MTRRLQLSRRQLLIAVLAVFGLNAAVFLVYTLPGVIRERTLTSRVTVLREEMERQRRQVERARQRDEVLKANAKDLDRFFKDVVKDRQQTLLPTLQYLERTAAQLGLTTTGRSYDEQKVKGLPIVRFRIQMPVSGQYRSLVSYLEKIERSEHFLVVDQIQLRGHSEAGSTVDLAFGMSTYIRAEEAPRAD